jgi:hypothetical protein
MKKNLAGDIFQLALQHKVLYIMSNEDQLQAIHEIRTLMNRSSRFLSLSGLSGIIIGALAIFCALYMHYLVVQHNELHGTHHDYVSVLTGEGHFNLAMMWRYGILAASLLAVSLTICFVLTYRQARKQGENMWDETALRVMKSLFIPLIVGGLVCLSFVFYGAFYFVAPMMLVFYGFALYNASKYTIGDIQSLGLIDMVLGIAGMIFLKQGLLFWAIGFGAMHIVYGAVMHLKYEIKRA